MSVIALGSLFLEYKLGQILKAGLGEPVPLVAIYILKKVKIKLLVLNFRAERNL